MSPVFACQKLKIFTSSCVVAIARMGLGALAGPTDSTVIVSTPIFELEDVVDELVGPGMVSITTFELVDPVGELAGVGMFCFAVGRVSTRKVCHILENLSLSPTSIDLLRAATMLAAVPTATATVTRNSVARTIRAVFLLKPQIREGSGPFPSTTPNAGPSKTTGG